MLGAVARPAVGSADVLQTDAVATVHGYRMTLLADNHTLDPTLDVILARRVGRFHEEHVFHLARIGFTQQGRRVAHLRARLARGGRIDLTFRGARRGSARPPEACEGTGVTGRRGALRGTFRFPAGDRYFRTLHAVARGAVLGLPAGRPNHTCDIGAFATNDVALDSLGPGPVELHVHQDRKGPHLYVSDKGQSPSGSVLHVLTGLAPRSAFRSPDLKKATLSGFGSLFAGRSTYTGTYTNTDPSEQYTTMGTLTGDFRARFDSAGAVRFPAGPYCLGVVGDPH